MAKKRKQRRSTSTGLTEDRADELVGGMGKFLLTAGYNAAGLSSPRQALFESEIIRKAVYLANRERLLDRAAEYQGPGYRPDAYFEYEAGFTQDEIDQDREELKRQKWLIDNNKMEPGELEALIADFIHSVNLYLPSLKSKYLSGSVRFNKKIFDKLKSRAEIYGGAALEEWQKAEAEILK